MKEFFIGFLVGVAVTATAGGYFLIHKHTKVRAAQDLTAAAFQRTAEAVQAKLEAWHLNTADIERELTGTGRVVRRQMSDFGAAVADAAGDAKITGKIKAKFTLDKELSVLGISVNTTDGRVTLSGDVTNAKQISRAMMLALETDGVREVSSTLHVKQ